MQRQINASERDITPSRSWYALYTRHQHEKTVDKILTHKGYETFLPLYSVSSKWKDRTTILSLPLFPCYVFLKGGLDRRLELLSTPGIHSVVSCSGQPTAIPVDEMDAVRRALQSGAHVEPHLDFKYGDWVRVKKGTLEGLQGVLVRKRNKSRLILSVDVLGKSVAVEIDGVTVERVEHDRHTVHSAGMGSRSAVGRRIAAQPILSRPRGET